MRRTRRAVRQLCPLPAAACAFAFAVCGTVRPLQAAPSLPSQEPAPQQVPNSVQEVSDTLQNPVRRAVGVPVMDIPTRADAAREQLVRLAAAARPDPDVNALAATLADSLDLLDDLLAATQDIDIGQLSRLQCGGHGARLDATGGLASIGGTEQVDGRWRELRAAWDTTKQAQSLWITTRNRLELDESSPAVRASLSASVDGVLAHADSVETLLDHRLAFVVGMQRELSARRQAIDLTIQRFSTGEAESRLGLLAQDSPPIWRLSVSDYGWDTLGLRARQSWQNQGESLRSFLRLDRGRVSLHVLFFLLLFALLLVVGRWARDEDERRGRALRPRRWYSVGRCRRPSW